MEDEFYRIKRLPPYVIAEVNDMRAAARASGGSRRIAAEGVLLDPAAVLNPGVLIDP